MRRSKYADGLDRYEEEKIRDDLCLWQANFVIRFYELLEEKQLRKKDIPILIENDPNVRKWLSSSYYLSNSTLTECTKYNSKDFHSPNVELVVALAALFRVTPDHLLGFDTNEMSKSQCIIETKKSEIIDRLLAVQNTIQDKSLLRLIKEYEELIQDVSDNDSEHRFFLPKKRNPLL